MKNLVSKQNIACIMIVLAMCVSLIANGEYSSWDCPKCGRTGNTENYCEECGTARLEESTPSESMEKSAPELPQTENLSGSPMLFSKTTKDLAPDLISVWNEANEWTIDTAPKTIQKLPLLPDNWEKIVQWVRKLKISLKKNEENYEIKMNQKDSLKLLDDLDCWVSFGNTIGGYSGFIVGKAVDGHYSFPASKVNTPYDTHFRVDFRGESSQSTNEWTEDFYLVYTNPISGMKKFEYAKQMTYLLTINGMGLEWFFDESNGYSFSLYKGTTRIKEFDYFLNGKLIDPNKCY